MAMDLGAGAGGAIALQDVLKNLFERANANQVRQQEQQRINIEQQRANDENGYRTMAAQSAADARTAAAKAQAGVRGLRIAGATAPGTVVGADTSQALKDADLGDLLQHQGATLASTAMQGGAMAGAQAPMAAPMRATQNAGHGEQDMYTGTAAQNQAIEDRQTRAAQIEQARQDRIDAARQAAADRAEQATLVAGLRPPAAAHFQLVPGTGPDGKPAMFRVNTQSGESNIVDTKGGSLGAPPKLDSTTANRLQSAQAVTQTGDDIVAMLKDPKIAAQLGPAMSRYNSIADFVGAPPPEFGRLAGMIESYSLANMGVHGMRSNNGAEAIKGTLGLQRHTPESMIATIEGLNGFANHLLVNNGKGAAGPAAPAAGGSALDILNARRK